MSTSSNAPKDFLKTLNVLSIALIAGLTFFAAIIFYLVQQNGPTLGGDEEMTDLFNWLVPAGFMVALAGSQLLFRKGLESAATKKKPLIEELN